jgi:hypothetical protein
MPKKMDKKKKRKTLKKRVAPKTRFQQITDVKAVISRLAKKKELEDKAMEEKRILEARLLALEGKRPLDDRTPYAQRTLYGSGNFNRAGDKYDVGIKQQEQEKKITQLAEQLEEIDLNTLQATGEPLTLRGDKGELERAKKTAVKLRGSGRGSRKNRTVNITSIQPASNTDPKVREPDTVVAPLMTRGDRGGIATINEAVNTSPFGLKKDGTPYKRRPNQPKGMTGIAEATPNYQNSLIQQQQQNLTDVLASEADMGDNAEMTEE